METQLTEKNNDVLITFLEKEKFDYHFEREFQVLQKAFSVSGKMGADKLIDVMYLFEREDLLEFISPVFNELQVITKRYAKHRVALDLSFEYREHLDLSVLPGDTFDEIESIAYENIRDFKIEIIMHITRMWTMKGYTFLFDGVVINQSFEGVW